MKEVQAFFITTLVVVAILAGFGLTAGMLEAPQTSVEREINARVELAQRLLESYAPSSSALALELEQELEPLSGDAPPATDDEVVMGEDQLARVISQFTQGASQLGQQFQEITGDAPSAPPGARDALAGVRSNEAMLDQALRAITEAVQMSEGSGESAYSGSSHVEATRLRALLIYYKADLLRRKAELQHQVAREHRDRFERVYDQWQTTDNRIRSLGYDLAAHMESSTDTQPADSKLDPIPERVKALETQAKQVAGDIKTTQQLVDELTAIVNDLQTKLDAASSQASRAHARMLELESKGVDTSDPSALPAFKDAYTAASEAYRAASREAQILEFGAIRNTKIDTEDENELITAPLAPRGPGEMTPSVGLRARQAELAGAQTRLERQQALLAEINKQIADLNGRETRIRDRVAKLEQRKRDLASQATEAVTPAMKAAGDANAMQTEAIDLLSGQGVSAAAAAKRAAAQRKQAARNKQAESPESPDERLAMMAGDKFTEGHASALGGDIHYLQALIELQQADNLVDHADMLRGIERMSLDTQALSGGADVALTDMEAAETAAAEARQRAAQAVEEAIPAYEEAAGALGDLWNIHVSLGAAHHLRALAEPDPEAAQAHRDNAAKEFERSIRDRQDRPEAGSLRPIIDSLTKAQ